MKRFFSLVIALILGILAATAQKSEMPRIEFIQNIYNYDTIIQDGNGVCTFLFKNTGNAPLIISSTSASCGCTTPSFDKKPVMPGKTGKITVKYNTSLVGPFRKTIVVKSNAANQGTSILTIKGYVKSKQKKE